MKKILNYFEDSRLGGPQNYMLSLASNNDPDYQYDFLISNKDSLDFEKKLKSMMFNYHSLNIQRPQNNAFQIIKYSFLFPFDVLKIYKFLKNNNYSLIYICGGSWQIKGVIAAKLSKTPIVWHLNDTYVPSLIKTIFSILSRFTTNYVFASNKTKEYYFPLIKEIKNSDVIPSPIDTNFFLPSKNKAKIKELLVGSISNISPVKGLENLLEIAKKISSINSNIRFIHVGNIFESQKKYFEFLLEYKRKNNINNFQFIGFKKDVRKILSEINLYICTSKNESSPISVLEAMSMEIPIISYDVGDIKDFISDDYNGYIIKNSDEAINKLLMLLDNKESIDRLGKNSRKVVLKNFNHKICGEKHKIFFNKIKDF